MSNIPRTSLACRQNGAALVVGLILLLIMTVVAVAGMQSSIFEERMASNFRDQNLGFQTAETALKEGERFVMNIHPDEIATATAVEGVYLNNASAVGDFRDPDLSLSAVSATGTAATNVVDNTQNTSGPFNDNPYITAAAPQYVVELLQCGEGATGEDITFGAVPPRTEPPNKCVTTAFYRVTARGIGRDQTSETMLESTFLRRYSAPSN